MISEKALVTDGVTTIYSVGFEIISEDHCNVLLATVLQSTDTYDVINNAIVFNTAPTAGIDLMIRVGTTVNDLAAAPTDIGICATNITSINAVAGNETNIDAAVANATNINAAVANEADIDTVAANIANVNTVAGNTTNINAVNANETNINSAVANTTNINAAVANEADIDTVAASIANVNTTATNIANVNTTATNIASVNTTATNIANVNTVAGISGNVTTVAGDTIAINAVNANSANITTVAGIDANVTTVAGIDANVTTVAGISADVTTVATNIAKVSTVATDIAKVIKVADDLSEAISEVETVANDLNETTSEINTVAASITNVDTVGTNIANVNTVAGISANTTTVAGISGNVTTVAGVSGDVTTVATNIADVTSVATNMAEVLTADTNAAAAAASLVATNADVVLTNQDTIDTAADLVQTNLDTIQTAADRVATTADANSASSSASSALTSKNAAKVSEDAALVSKLAAAAIVTGATVSTTDIDTATVELSAYNNTTAITGDAVDVFIYDTSNDSDGGAWRKRTQHTSWYNETLNTSTRGSRKEFPSVAVIVADNVNDKVTIYDGDTPDLDMWMVYQVANGKMLGEGDVTAIAALNGIISVACGGSGHDFYTANMVEDTGYQWFTAEYKRFYSNVATRNVVANASDVNASFILLAPIGLISRKCNDVAMTVLPNAPIDSTTGLPIPTIAVATDGGVSVIKDDGTVVDYSDSASARVYDTVLFDDGYIFGRNSNSQQYKGWILGSSDRTSVDINVYRTAYIGASYVGSAFLGTINSPLAPIALGAAGAHSIGTNQGLTQTSGIKTPATGSVAYLTSNYNTGWMTGDIKGAWLADTDTTNVVGTELVTNGTFDTNTTGWTADDATLAVVSGTLEITATNASNYGSANIGIATAVGKVYTISLDLRKGTSIGADFNIGTTLLSSNILNSTDVTSATFVNESYTFTASTTTTYIKLRVTTITIGETAYFDNVSVKLADADRSVNNNGLQVNGTITKTAVATGAELVAYSSGFSASNYLEQPYNADLDFGTGDFSVMGWFKIGGSGSTLFERGAVPRAGNGMTAWMDATGKLVWYKVVSGTTSEVVSSSSSYNNNTWVHFSVIRQSGVVSLYFNGEVDGSAADTTDMDNTSAVLRLGVNAPGSSFWVGSLALFRISATAPTATQIKEIYEAEKPLFQENAKCTLNGASDAVQCLAYDDSTELLHVGTSAGRSTFSGLRRVDETSTNTTEISAQGGMIIEETA